MKKITKWIKKNVLLFTLIIVVIVLMGIFIFFLTQIMFSNDDKYNNRIKEETHIAFTDEALNILKSSLDSNIVINVDIEVSGKMIKVFIEYDITATKEKAVTKVEKSLDVIPEDIKAYYDIQYFLTSGEENKDFPIIGYVHKTNQTISW